MDIGDQIEFDDVKLSTYRSWTMPVDPPPRNQPLPPGPNEHMKNVHRVLRLARAAQRHPRAFRVILGRDPESDEEV